MNKIGVRFVNGVVLATGGAALIFHVEPKLVCGEAAVWVCESRLQEEPLKAPSIPINWVGVVSVSSATASSTVPTTF